MTPHSEPNPQVAMDLILEITRDARGERLAGKTLGLIGYGAVGRMLARRAAAFGMTIVYADAERAAGPHQRVLLGELLARSDVIIPLASLPSTQRRLIDSHALALIKRGAFLVDPSAGALVDEAAVAAALSTGQLGGYALPPAPP